MELREGAGWRLVWDPARPWPILIGGQDWAAELSCQEALLLLEGASRLQQQRGALLDQLLDDESLELEWESGPLWLALEGDRRQWSLRFVLQPDGGQRGVEGAWGPGASAALAAALQALAGELGSGAGDTAW